MARRKTFGLRPRKIAEIKQEVIPLEITPKFLANCEEFKRQDEENRRNILIHTWHDLDSIGPRLTRTEEMKRKQLKQRKK